MSSSTSSICYQYAETGSCRFGTRCKFEHAAGETTNPGAGSRSKRNKAMTSRFDGAPLDDFFSQYVSQGFDYDPHGSAHQEYRRLRRHMKWGRDHPEGEDAWGQFKDALTQQFNVIYGEDENELAAWQSLCAALEVADVPDTLQKCRDVIHFTFVNLVDFVDTQRTSESVQLFDSEVALSTYTQAEGKYFPGTSAYQSGLLRYLLRHILSPDANYRAGGQKGDRRK